MSDLYNTCIRAIFFGMILFIPMFVVEPATADVCAKFKVYIGALPPFNYVDAKGDIKGIMVDALGVISRRAGNPINPQDMNFVPFPRAVDTVKHVPGTLVFALARTPEREESFAWVGPVDYLLSGLVAKKSRNIRIHSEDELRNYIIGTIRKSAPEALLHKIFGVDAKQIVSLPTNWQQLKMLAVDRLDLVTQSTTGAPQLLMESHLDPNDYEMVFVFRRINMYYAFSKQTDPRLIERLNVELQKLKTPGPDGKSEYSVISKRYLSRGLLSVVPWE